jgi:hypothetical protein
MTQFTYNGISYDTHAPHGSPFDRGSSDSYYRRMPAPHYYDKTTEGKTVRRTKEEMTPAQINEYDAGYAYNEMLGDYKDYGQYDYV